MKQVQEWKQFHPHIQSPDQCPAIANDEQLRQTLSPSAHTTLERWVDGKTSLRQMARYLNRDISAVARHWRSPGTGQAIEYEEETVSTPAPPS